MITFFDHRFNLKVLKLFLSVSFLLSFFSYAFAQSSGLENPDAAQARIDAMNENNHGRMIVTFQGRNMLPQYTSEVMNGVLMLKFEEAIAADLDEVRLRLSDYITVARIDPDGKSLRFALKREVKINTIEAGEKLFIDLLPQNWVGLPPGLPSNVIQNLAERAQKAAIEAAEAERQRLLGELEPEVVLKMGRHPTFTRLKFDWNIPFKATLSRRDQTLSLKFDLRVDIDLSRIQADLPSTLTSIEKSLDPDGLVLALELDEEADVRAFQDGLSYVIDLTSDELKKFEPAVSKLRDTLNIGNDDQSVLNLASQKTPTARSDEHGLSQKELSGVVRTGPVQTDVLVAVHPQGDEAELIAQQQNVDTAFETPSQQQDAIESVERAVYPEQLPQSLNQSSRFLYADARKTEDGVRIHFPFKQETAATVFQRGQSIWMIFDTDLPIDVRSIRKETSTFSSDLDVSRQDSLLVLRMDTSRSFLVTASNEANGWVVTLGDAIESPAEQLKVEHRHHADGRPYGAIAISSINDVVSLKDPFVGDEIIAVTVLPQPRGFLRPQYWAEFDALVTSHGIAIVSKADDLNVSFNKETKEVEINRPSGLALSGSVALYGRAHSASSNERLGFIDMQTWYLGGADFYTASLEDLSEKISESTDDFEMVENLLNLGKFYLSHQLGSEALGVMNLAYDLKPALEQDMSFQILYGAGHYMAGRLDEANKILGILPLKNNADAAIWRVLINAELENWQNVRDNTTLAKSVLDSYTRDMQGKVHLAFAEAALGVNDIARVNEHLGHITPERLDNIKRAHFEILSARLAEAVDDVDRAIEHLDTASSLDAGPEAAEATLYRVKMLYERNQISANEVISQLELLTAGWRGDHTELKARKVLTRLYVDNEDYRSAFSILKDAVMAASDAPIVRTMHDTLSQEFVDLFLYGKADKMPAMKALALFYDFRELTPIGRQGDELVRRLSNKLVDVDLLAQAADLLRHQVDHRLRGMARAQVAADLAVIYLMDSRAHEALKILQQTRLSNVPIELQRQRRKIEARALAETGRVDLSLELLKNLDGPDADLLRADALWDDERWQESAEVYERLMGERWSGPSLLTKKDRLNILRSAIAYSLAGDSLGLERLRRKFAKKMANSDDAYAFEVVSSDISARGIAFKDVARQVAGVDTLKAFLNEYRERYKDLPLDNDIEALSRQNQENAA